jgi:hypothetical protein
MYTVTRLLYPRRMLVDAPFNTITGQVIGAAIEGHRINFNVPKPIDGVTRVRNRRVSTPGETDCR